MIPVMSIRPPDEIRDFLKRIAIKKGITINALVIDIFWDFISKQKKVQENRA